MNINNNFGNIKSVIKNSSILQKCDENTQVALSKVSEELSVAEGIYALGAGNVRGEVLTNLFSAIVTSKEDDVAIIKQNQQFNNFIHLLYDTIKKESSNKPFIKRVDTLFKETAQEFNSSSKNCYEFDDAIESPEVRRDHCAEKCYLLALPRELLIEEILQYLSQKDLLRFFQTSKQSLELRSSVLKDILSSYFKSLLTQNSMFPAYLQTVASQNIDPPSSIFAIQSQDFMLQQIRQMRESIKRLDLSKCAAVSNTTVAAIAQLFPNLREINISYTKITDAGLQHLTTLTGLQHVNLAWCNNITDAGLEHLKTFTALQHLDLAGCRNITDTGLQHLTALTGLQHVSLAWCNNITDAGLEHLKTLTALQHLDLAICDRITNTGLQHLKILTGLQHVNIIECDEVSDTGLQHLTTLTGLQHLDLACCNKITDTGLQYLKTLTDLQHLNLVRCNNITDAGLQHLKTLTDLQHLNLAWCNQITDIGLQYLKTLTGLQYLNLAGCGKIADTELQHLIINLKHLDLKK